ncbi:MAG: hypothetical protein J7K54_03910 [Candidatus Aenigmarchaeota archaeon]|nr:hypothetical protein [Candidatus Aenigmarchaeota archaeon]
MKGKIMPYLLSGGIAFGSYGCATMENLKQDVTEHIQELNEAYRSRINDEKTVSPYTISRDEMKKLHVSRIQDVRIWPGGIKAPKNYDSSIKEMAGIYSGSVKVRKTPGGYAIEGTYTHDPESLGKVFKDIDSNGDKLLTPKEIITHLDNTLKKYAK